MKRPGQQSAPRRLSGSGWQAVAAPLAVARIGGAASEELLRAGRLADALPPLDRALEIAPDNVHARGTSMTALRMAAADPVAGPDVLRGFVAAAGSRHPAEAAWASEALRRLEAGP